MDLSDPLFSRVDLGLLVKRLTACAAKWFLQEGCSGDESVLPATGKSAQELAFDTAMKFIKGEVELRPTSEESVEVELYRLLRRVMRNDFLDLVKEGREYKRTKVLEPSDGGESTWGEHGNKLTLADLPGKAEEGFYSLNAAIVARRVLPFIKGDAELENYVDAVLRGGCTKREDIATYLGITVQEVTSLRKKLRLRLAPWKQSLDAAMIAPPKQR
ncbi:MAG: hypothetical protein M3362_00995 [Acidobacteriota bacterium]|nr:hypothetical protein [Acidobacteriota bacterium]